MKLTDAKGNETTVTWGDHWPGCDKCREVNLAASGTFSYTCAQGAPLLLEELAKRQAPVVKQRAAAVRDWADKTGVFKMGKSKTTPMKYKE